MPSCHCYSVIIVVIAPVNKCCSHCIHVDLLPLLWCECYCHQHAISATTICKCCHLSLNDVTILCVNSAIVIWLVFDTVCNVAVIVCNVDVNSYVYSLSNILYQRNLHGGTSWPPPDHIPLMPPLIWTLLCVCKCCHYYSHEFVIVCNVGANYSYRIYLQLLCINVAGLVGKELGRR